MATNLVAKMEQNYLPPALITLLIRNGMGYRNLTVYALTAQMMPLGLYRIKIS